MAAESWRSTGSGTSTARGEGGQRRDDRGELRVLFPDGMTVFLRYDPRVLGADLKRLIADAVQLDQDSFWIEHNGKAIVDECEVDKQDLWGQNVRLVAHARLRGGAPQPPVFNAMVCAAPAELAQ